MSDLPHLRHSNLVGGWKARGESLHVIEGLAAQRGHSHRLKSPHEGYAIAVSFTELKDHPGKMLVQATNWRAEDEPNAIYSREDCRAFWKDLTAAGFVAF